MVSRRKWAILAAGAVVIIAGLTVSRHNHGPRTATGGTKATLAPDFTLTQLDGQPLRLSSYRGKIILLDFWATWCDPCREEIPHFIELQNKYGQRGFQVIGVSMDDTPDPVRTFYQQYHMNYPVVMGNAGIGEQYGGVLGLPIAFLLDREGRIAAKHIGAAKPETIEKEAVTLMQNR